MSSFPRWAACALVFAAVAASAQQRFPGIGRSATEAEVRAWDIDVRADFKGLPKGQGSVALGLEVWEAKCASCHGVFGESNDVFFPIVGGTTRQDIVSGRVARLADPAYPQRTTLMKLSTVSSLWDYINRAMPWTAPKTLTTEEVYAVTAYILHLGDIVPDDFVLSDRNIAEVQQRLPNRNGMTTAHALWPGSGLGGTTRPDVQAGACMSGCAGEPKLASYLPEHARDAHGNLADQQRRVGPMRGAVTVRTTAAAPAASTNASPLQLLQKNACLACHANDVKLVGPAFKEVAARYAGRADRVEYLAGKIRGGAQGSWGAIPMPAQTQLSEAEAQALAKWIANLNSEK
ncbi:c-type cytochrome [Schlegelella sp. S2-27]|uniref:C-type cytochrome n=1 Tax=Caldimonas mangrovi TaxID=2944811 RepID=A0ABT0YQG1_9BURK|nr:c-type cytochrome [Caldimonas mangrovi]MCM5680985.1 c-type cytochrome [Caldimonas mangrovi]